jgi:lipopolysaccharide biosynthesis glycosyltransferase
MITDDVSAAAEEFLRAEFDNVIRVPTIAHAVMPMKSKKQNTIYGAWIHASFTKWNILCPDLFPAEKVILVDADMIFRENCDDLFDLRAPALTFSSPWVKPYHPRGGFNPYGELAHGAEVSTDRIRRGLRNGIVGLACMVLVRPDAWTHAKMLSILRARPKYGDSRCMAGFDEQLIAETLLATGDPIYHIHQSYNWIVGKHDWLVGSETPKTQQYYNGKPWHGVTSPESRRTVVDEGEWEDVREWWTYADEIMAANPASVPFFYPGVIAAGDDIGTTSQ